MFIIVLLFVILLIVTIGKLGTLSRKVSLLEEEIARIKIDPMRSAVSPKKPAPETSPAQPAETVTQLNSKVELASIRRSGETRRTLSESLLSPPFAKTRPVPSIVPPLPSARSKEELEALIGGKLMNRIGALALILGVGFFLKYAFDNNWITETMRVVTGLVIGAGLLLLGSRSHKKGFQIFAQGIVGAGISILYLSVYASFNFYHLVPQTFAFLMMSAVTIFTFRQAFQYDSLAVSLLGWAGGFITPFLLSTGQSNEVGLFTYITLLDVGLIAIIFKKDSWRILLPLTLVATYLVYFSWVVRFYSPEDLFQTVYSLSIFWILFFILDLFQFIQSPAKVSRIGQTVTSFNAVFYTLGMYLLIDKDHHAWMGLVTMIMGAVYFFTVLAIKRKVQLSPKITLQYILTAIVLLVLATAIQFSGFITVVLWSLEALVLLWCGIHWRTEFVRQSALVLFAITSLYLVFMKGALVYSPIDRYTFLFNHRALAFSVLASTLGIGAMISKFLDEEEIKQIRSGLFYSCFIVLFIFSTVETRDFFEKAIFLLREKASESELTIQINRLKNLRELGHSGVWLLYSILLMLFGFWRRNQGIRIVSIVLFGLTIPKIFFYDLSFLDTLYRIFSFVGLGLILLAVSFLYQRYKSIIFIENT